MQSRAALCKIINVEINARGNTRREKEEEEGKKNKITNVLKGDFLSKGKNEQVRSHGWVCSQWCMHTSWLGVRRGNRERV